MKKMCSKAPILSTQSYTKNPDSPLGKELDLQLGNTHSYIIEHEDSEHWWLAEDNTGQVGYVPGRGMGQDQERMTGVRMEPRLDRR